MQAQSVVGVGACGVKLGFMAAAEFWAFSPFIGFS